MPTITFRRASNIQNIPITDGQIIFDTNRNIILMDNGNVRNQYAGATQLISTTPEATSTNAFNAQASTQLFLQKTTVIDTKANALAVNQNYVPLGCLAFKEALGTTNYSNVGNGTISGALVYLNNQMNNQLTANGNKFYFDYQNGKYGYNTSSNRGADTFHPFKATDEIIAALPKSLYCEGYHGGISDDDNPSTNGYASSSTSVTVPFKGTLVCSLGSSGAGSKHITVSKNGTNIFSIYTSGSNGLEFEENDVLAFSMGISDLKSWGRGSASASFTWTAI